MFLWIEFMIGNKINFFIELALYFSRASGNQAKKSSGYEEVPWLTYIGSSSFLSVLTDALSDLLYIFIFFQTCNRNDYLAHFLEYYSSHKRREKASQPFAVKEIFTGRRGYRLA